MNDISTMNRKRLRKENSTIYEQNNIYIKCEKDEYLEINETDLKQSSDNESSYQESPYITSENTKDDFKNNIALWAAKHKISHIALKELFEKLQQHSCFATLTLDASQKCYDNVNDDVNPIVITINTSTTEPLCTHDDDNDKNDDPPIILTNNMSNSNLNEQKMEIFQNNVIKKLTNLELKINNISEKMEEIHTNQKLMLEKISPSSTSDIEQKEIDVFEDLPLEDENSLQLMEEKLKNHSSYRNQMIKQLTRLTCNNVKTSCLRIIKSVLTNELAEKYSWYGAKKKKIFSKLNICKIIMSVIRKSHKDVTDEQISAPIKIWLVHAKERMERFRNLQQEANLIDSSSS